MKMIIKYKKYSKWGLAIGTLLLISACTKDFADINTNPSTVITPEIKFLLTYSEERMAAYQGDEWVWESTEQMLRFTQHYSIEPI